MDLPGVDHSLHQILREAGLDVPSGLGNPLIKSLTCDSRSAAKGSLFLGLPGEKVDGGIFWPEAFKSGAVAAVIGPAAAKKCPPAIEDVVIIVPEPVGKIVGELAAAFWQFPSERVPLIGVTGTNGKTTTTFLIEHLSNSLARPTALFGTLVNRWPRHSGISTHTTAFADVLQDQLAEAVSQGVELAVMEVSSHALFQHRVAGCQFAGAVFTNLTQDHLDYHNSMEEYFETKALLFEPPLFKRGADKTVVNIDNEWGAKLAERLGDSCWRSSLSEKVIKSSLPELTMTQVEMTSRGFKGVLRSPLGEGAFVSPLIGRFNLMNLLQSVGVLLQQGFPLDPLLEAVNEFSGVPGRMERVQIPSSLGSLRHLPEVIVDYAHTPDGLKNALIALRPFAKGELVCVFGCGGDRDRGKRSQMGAVAAQLADRIILTSDNPRTEGPQDILDDVLKGVPLKTQMEVVVDRASAIELAISKSSVADVVLIAGKGHEDYQIIGLDKIYFDDREEARQALRKRKSN